MGWPREQLAGHRSHTSHPKYHLCCGDGRIFMEPEVDPPEYIKDLLANNTFMQNIRAYNQMFAMTSFGAKIDNTVNQRRGSYVFKVSGTPPTSPTKIDQDASKNKSDEDNKSKTAKRALFQDEPSDAKKQKELDPLK
ncbi:hypothetical protein CTI12_AA410420 [Artemisia annua]|uniref:Uncharacterized protein n=1 Tax=Artemisia annua TaxID=35608 RepID=A0A2U1M7M2_ARTAN|nr:hypothetical protein CTI12_AA410420 [Artemisia annua]